MNAVVGPKIVGATQVGSKQHTWELMPSAGEPGGEPQKERVCGASWVMEGLAISTWDGVVEMCVCWGGGLELKPLVPGPDSKQTVHACALPFVGDLGRVVDPRSSVDLNRTHSSTLHRSARAVRRYECQSTCESGIIGSRFVV